MLIEKEIMHFGIVLGEKRELKSPLSACKGLVFKGGIRVKAVLKENEMIMWEAPAPNSRRMGIYFERDITPTSNIAAGIVTIPAHQEQTKLSYHNEGEEIYYIVKGKGKFVLDDKEYDVEDGTAVYVAPGIGHRAKNTGNEEMKIFYVNTPPVFGRVGGYIDFVKDWKRIS